MTEREANPHSVLHTAALVLIIVIVLLLMAMCSVSRQKQRVEFAPVFQWAAYLKTVSADFYLMNDRYPVVEDAERMGLAAELPPTSELTVNWLSEGGFQLVVPGVDGVIEYRPRISGPPFNWECRVSESIVDMAPINCKALAP